jgi:hypothetical protein
MPGSATTYLEQAVLGHTLAFAPMTQPAGIYIGLTTTTPTAGTGGTEVAAGGYVRAAATFALLSIPPNVAANANTTDFPSATEPWGMVGWFELWDAQTGGNRLYWGPLVDPTDGVTPITRNIEVGDIMRFQAGVLQVQAI